MDTFKSTLPSEASGEPLKHRKSVFAYFRESLDKCPDHDAIVIAFQRDTHLAALKEEKHEFASSPSAPTNNPIVVSEGSCWTYRQLHIASLRFVAALHQEGVRPGSMIVRFVPNSIEWAIMFWSGRLGKFAETPLDPTLLTAPRFEELQLLLRVLKPSVIVVHNVDGAAIVDSALEQIKLNTTPKVKLVLSQPLLSDDTPATSHSSTGWTAFPSFCTSFNPPSQEQISAIEDDALEDDILRVDQIAFTSGTSTGQPKGCPRPVAFSIYACELQDFGPGLRGHYYQSILQRAGAALLEGHPRMLLAVPNFRAMLPYCVAPVWAQGGTVVIPSLTPNPVAMVAAVPKYKITHNLLIPSALYALDSVPDFAVTDTSTLQSLVLGGDSCTEEIYVKAATMFPQCEVIPGFGMTEGAASFWAGCAGFTGMDIARAAGLICDNDNNGFHVNRNPKLGRLVPFHSRIASVGKVTPGSRIRIVGDNNEPVLRGEVGDLHLSSAAYIQQYLNSANSEDFYVEETIENGRTTKTHWFKTGDVAIMDPDGWVFIVGRKKDIIKRLGLKVVPSALESCLDAFLKSKNIQTIILAQPHRVLGHVPVAIVRSSVLEDHTKDDIANEVIAKFGMDYAIGDVLTLEELGFTEYPVSGPGKISKVKLLEAAADRWATESVISGH